MNAKTNTANSTGHRILTIIGIVLCVILIPMLIINCTMICKQLINRDEVPTVGGIFPMIVLTDSMQGTFDSGSLLICKTADPAEVEVGDIICFYDPAGRGSTTVTHRVARIETGENGTISFITKGDANNVEDSIPVPAENLVGVYRFHIAGLGSVAMFMQTTTGLVIFVALPILLLIGYDMIRRRIDEKKKNGETAALQAELQALRAEKAVRERSDASPDAADRQ